MPRPHNPIHRRFLEEWPDLSQLPDKQAAARLDIPLRTYQRWKQELASAGLFDPRTMLYQLLEERKTCPPGPQRDRLDLAIEQARWRIDNPFDPAVIVF